MQQMLSSSALIMEGGLINFSSFLFFLTAGFFLSSVVIFAGGREEFDTIGSGVLELGPDVGIPGSNVKLVVVVRLLLLRPTVSCGASSCDPRFVPVVFRS
jgi:hypothetical protein